MHGPLTPLHVIVESYKETGKDVSGLAKPGQDVNEPDLPLL
jgi:hypothetical protein